MSTDGQSVCSAESELVLALHRFGDGSPSMAATAGVRPQNVAGVDGPEAWGYAGARSNRSFASRRFSGILVG